MFSASFSEGQRLLVEGCPVVELGDDDPELMGLILRILHYQGSPTEYVMEAERLAKLSLLCDKYDCTKSLGPWIPTWLRNVGTKDVSPQALGSQILAAYMFGDSLEFRNRSRTATLQLAASSVAVWEEEEPFAVLPSSVTGKPGHVSRVCYR
jgi:hypothetical protein